MKKNQGEQERARSAYVPPQIEVHGTELSHLMGRSFYGDHIQAEDGNESDHERAGDGGEITGAKTVILGQEFGFSDVWEN